MTSPHKPHACKNHTFERPSEVSGFAGVANVQNPVQKDFMETPRFLIGYARVSTQGQTLDAQLDQLRAAGCVAVFAEKAGGANVRQRPELAKALASLPIGGLLVVTRLDRLGRNISDIWRMVQTIEERGAGLRSLAEPWANTTTPTGKLLLGVLAWAAEIERGTILERTAEGLARAKARGKRLGRPPRLNPAQQREALRMHSDDKKLFSEIAELLGVSRSTVSRFINRHKKSGANAPQFVSPLQDAVSNPL